jgi:hypothetical protein
MRRIREVIDSAWVFASNSPDVAAAVSEGEYAYEFSGGSERFGR